MPNLTKAKILLYDIETMANESYTWGIWEQDVLYVKRPWYIISFAYKWLGEGGIKSYSLPYFPHYKKDKKNDKELCRELWKLFDEADIIVAHNGSAFDSKKSVAKFLQHGFKPPTPYQVIDTLTIAKRYFKFDSNRLDSLAQYLGVGKKINTGGFQLWLDCAVHDKPEAWRKMDRYNRHDVKLLEEVYYKFRPYITNHPNLNLINRVVDNCPNCGGVLQKRGFRVTRVGRYQRFQCQSCAAWSSKSLKGIVR